MLVSSGGTANRTSAVSVEVVPSPNGLAVSASSTSAAKVGTARPMFEMFTASAPPRPMWPSQSAIGSATRAASATAAG